MWTKHCVLTGRGVALEGYSRGQHGCLVIDKNRAPCCSGCHSQCPARVVDWEHSKLRQHSFRSLIIFIQYWCTEPRCLRTTREVEFRMLQSTTAYFLINRNNLLLRCCVTLHCFCTTSGVLKLERGIQGEYLDTDVGKARHGKPMVTIARRRAREKAVTPFTKITVLSVAVVVSTSQWFIKNKIKRNHHGFWSQPFEHESESVSRDSLLVKHRTRDRTVASSNPGRRGGRIFFSRVNFVCWLLFGVPTTSVLPQWHVNTPVILPKVQVAGYT